VTPHSDSKPRSEAIGLSAFIEMLPDTEQRLLANIFGDIRIADDCAGHGQRSARMPGNERCKCSVISRTGSSYERGISARVLALRLILCA
jgi:hypothetical protein